MMTKIFRETSGQKGTFIGFRGEEEPVFDTLKAILKLLKKRGWAIQTDQEIKERFPTLAKNHWQGKKGELQFKAKRSGWSNSNGNAEIEFFQNVNTKNSNGGQYDFDKLKLMPYLLKCQFLVELKHITDLLEAEGYKNNSEPAFATAIDAVMYRIKTSGHYKEGRELPDYEIDSYNNLDRNKKQIKSEDIKYFRDRKGRLMRGKVYYNLNNMWWVILNKTEYTNLSAGELFDLDSFENLERKKVKTSGHHKRISRIQFDVQEKVAISNETKKMGKEGRLAKANQMLRQLYNCGWTSRLFSFELKESGRLGLLELQSRAWGRHVVHSEPLKLSLYAEVLPMSNSEGYWVKALREYVVHSNRTITEWFCNDNNGEGPDSHFWPEIRRKAWEIGVLVPAKTSMVTKEDAA